VSEERWFEPEELAEMARPTLDRVIEAIEAGDNDGAIELCRSMKSEWRFLHDLMAESMLGLVDFIKRRFGEEQVPEAWTESMERGWRSNALVIASRDRRDVVEALAATWRAHSTSGVGPHPGSFTIEEDDEKFTLTDEAHDWSFDRAGMPLYCTHCTFMNEKLPIEWLGFPLYPLDPPEDFGEQPCRWYWYKNPADIPERFFARYGFTKQRSDE
jgi:hypothetical protein